MGRVANVGYPTDYTAYNNPYPKKNLRYRADLLKNMDESAEFAIAIRSKCKRDILFWLNCFCWVKETNVGKKTGKLPFVLYPYQKRVVGEITNAIDKGKDIIIRKSRDMGMSYLMLYIFQWYWLFGNEGNDFLIGSINAAKTDTQGNMTSLFEKLRYNLYSQPKQLMPKGFKSPVLSRTTKYNKKRGNDHSNRSHDGNMKLLNPETGNSITGDSNKFFATAGRYKAVLFDEFAKWEDNTDRLGWQSASDSSPCKIAVSSVNGAANLFYDLWQGKAGEIKKLSIMWREHPLKDTRWYEGEKKRRSSEDLAAEVDGKFFASIGNKAAANFDEDIHVKEVRGESNLPLQLNCDFNVNPMFWVVSQIIGGERRTFKEYYVNDALTDNVIDMFVTDFSYWKCKEIELYGDATGKFASTRNRLSDWDIIKSKLKTAGWEYHDCIPIRNSSIYERINIVNKRLKDTTNNDISWEVIDKKCVNLITSLQTTQRDYKGSLLKNGLEHGFDAWSYQLVKNFSTKRKRGARQIKIM